MGFNNKRCLRTEAFINNINKLGFFKKDMVEGCLDLILAKTADTPIEKNEHHQRKLLKFVLEGFYHIY